MNPNNKIKKTQFMDPYIKLKKCFICPNCGSKEYIPIVYGKGPSREVAEKMKKGEILFGGCCVNKRRCCKNCKTCY